MERKRILLISDTHHCHIDWYGVSSDERMKRLVRDIKSEYEKEPFEMILFLGDYSLDHWKWNIKGSWLESGKSYTAELIEKYFSDLPPVPYYMIAGNHEQYGEDKWKEITGCSRSFHVVVGDYLIVLWDSYGADLDPDFHSDGRYTPINERELRSLMAQYPDKKVILGSHYFDVTKEPESVAELFCDDRVICAFAGHTHKANVITLPESFGSKKLIFTGNYSYCSSSINGDPRPYMWGFRDLYLEDNRIFSSYIIPENEAVFGEERTTVPYQKIESVDITF